MTSVFCLISLTTCILMQTVLTMPRMGPDERNEEIRAILDELVRDILGEEDIQSQDDSNNPAERRTSGQSRTHHNIELLYHGERHGGAILDNIDMDTLNPDSDVAYLLESMVIGEVTDDGKSVLKQIDGVEKLITHTMKLEGDYEDTHKLTPEEKESMGIEDEGEDMGNSKEEDEEEIEEEMERGLDITKEKKRRVKRNFLRSARPWKNGIIPYVIHESLENKTKVIEDSVKLMSDLTCVKWVKKDDPLAQDLGHPGYVEFISKSGCWSYVGRIGGKQQISLSVPGCTSMSITLHEMGHAMGQMHEQSREDRDDYVDMHFDNVKNGASNGNMRKVGTYDRNPYDQESVLQYSLYAFALDRSKPVMDFKDRRLNFLANQGTKMSYYDVKDIIAGYKCTDSCTTKPECENAGFVNHECICYCPDGLTGSLCDQTSSAPECGQGIIDLVDGEKQTITSPNYPDSYGTNANCVWLFRAPQGRHVRLTIDDIDLPHNKKACDHWLEVQYNLIGQTGIRHCGQSRNVVYLTSDYGDVNKMMIKFENTFASDVTAGKGFTLTVETSSAACVSLPCLNGATCVDGEISGYKCICKSGYDGTNCEIINPDADLECDFEDNTCGFFADVTDDDFDWRTHSRGTPSKWTGPSKAHDGIRYLYTEMSSPRKRGDVARYESTLDLTVRDRCLRFYYHMYGNAINTLKVYTKENETRTVIWSNKGNKGDQWFEKSVDLPATEDLKVGFEASRGGDFTGDIAIDSIQLQTGSCYDSDLTCGFEDGQCSFLSDVSGDNFNWKVHSKGTPSKYTGPSSAQAGSKYLYAEMSGRKKYDVARYESVAPMSAIDRCLHFFYHMYGGAMGRLNFYTMSNGSDTRTNVWYARQNQGNKWHQQSIDLPATEDLKIGFEAVRGWSWNSDIAIDSIQLNVGPCPQTTEAPNTQTPMK